MERLLTLKCPRCEAAFLDFNGCFALTCHRCACAFCAYCLQNCGDDAHRHVARCGRNPSSDVFGTVEQFEASQRQRRQEMVRSYLSELEPTLRARVVQACQQDFQDLQVHV